MTLNEIVEKFKKRPSYVTNGAGRLSRLWDVPRDLVVEAKALYREDSLNSDMVVKSRWQNAAGVWLESYKATTDESNLEEELDLFKKDLLKTLTSKSKVYTGEPRISKTHGILAEISLPDYHFGKIAGTSLEDQGKEFVKAGMRLLDRVDTPDTILLPIGNDFFNSEHTGTTTKGTPQINNAAFYDMFTVGLGAVKDLIHNIHEKHSSTPIHIIIVPGNHDEYATVFLGEVLAAFYDRDNLVSVDSGPDHHKYVKYGKNLFMYYHGHVGKYTDYPLRMAIDRATWFAQCPYRFIKLGHFHKQMHDEVQGIEVTYMPSLASADKWHKDNNYISQPKASLVLYDRLKGKVATYNLYKEHIND